MPEQLFSRSSQGSLVAILLFAATAVFAQEKAAPPAQQPTTVLHASTQLVIVDVTVQDANGKPVHGLTPDKFQLLEGKTPQTIRNFEEHSNLAPSGPQLKIPPMPPGTFTDFVPVKPNSTLNIILFDSINTPIADQSYVREQLRKYVKQAPANAQIAIIGMGSKLTILQGFTSDPEVLKNAVDHKLTPRSSTLLANPVGSNTDQQTFSDMGGDIPGAAQASANFAQFEAETTSFQLQLRIQYTLDSFEALARYLAVFDGRKNLIWFSGSFPLSILPDDSIPNPFTVVASAEDEYREVCNLLTRAQIAVYPVDARGLMVDPIFDASLSSRNSSRQSNPAAGSIKFFTNQAAEHATMLQMAQDTGGHAFYNTNRLTEAVSQAIDSGSNYYTLTYSPSDHNWNRAYRAIHVNLEANASRNLKLSYRHGYYADDPSKSAYGNEAATVSADSATPTTAAASYARIALSRGAPAPSEILFKVRVLPASTTTEDAVATGNSPDPKLHGPYRRYLVDLAALPSDFSWKLDTNGHRLGEASFETLVFNADGSLLNSASKALRFNVAPEVYATLLKRGINLHLEVSAPAKTESFLRVAIQDVPSNRFGVVEIPTSSVSRLEPPLAPPESAPPPASPAPSAPPAAPANH